MANNTTEKQDIEQIEQAPSSQVESHGLGERGFEAEGVPKGYYFTPYFLGTTAAIGFNLMVSWMN